VTVFGTLFRVAFWEVFGKLGMYKFLVALAV